MKIANANEMDESKGEQNDVHSLRLEINVLVQMLMENVIGSNLAAK